MSSSVKLIFKIPVVALQVMLLLSAFISVTSWAKSLEKYGIGKPASQEEIAGWDIDVRPDGLGLPKGSGSVLSGEEIYEAKCASCHGAFGEGEGRWPALSGGSGTLQDDRPEKTVGSFWPYLSTLWDYIHRAMPFLEPQSLQDDEVYALTAYILYLNELVDEDFELSKENFSNIRLPNEIAFVDDPRPDVKNKRCMKNCRDKNDIKITWDSVTLGVTPISHLSEPNEVDDSKKLANEQHAGEATYKTSCAVCHDTGVAGAPSVNDSASWADRISRGRDQLLKHAIEGYQGATGYMPPKGGNASLSDEAVESAVEYITILVN